VPRIAQGETVGRVALRKRGKWWQARYSTPTGRVEEHMHVTSIEVARRKAGEINALLERGEHAALESLRAGQQVTFRVLVEEWKSTYTGWGPRTKAGAEGLINILVSTWGDMPLAHVNTKLINGYLAHRQAKGLAPATCNRYLSFLRRLFHCAVSWNYLARSPAAEVRFLKVQGKVPDALKEEQLEGLLAHLVDRHRPMVIVAVDTGLRRSEILELTWADVDWGERQVLVRKSKNADWRVVPLTDRAFGVLQALRQKSTKAKTQRLENRIFHTKDIGKSLDEAAARAGMGHVHFHQLRHTFATRLRDRGVPLDRIKELLGHKSMVMVLRYAKARPEQLRSAIATLNG